MLKWLLWGPALATVLSAFLIPGVGLVVLAVPVLGIGWAVFSLVAQSGPVPAEVRDERR